MMWDNADAPRRVSCNRGGSGFTRRSAVPTTSNTAPTETTTTTSQPVGSLVCDCNLGQCRSGRVYQVTSSFEEAKVPHAAAAASTTPTATVLAEQEHVAAKIAVSAPTACLSHRIRTLGAGYNEHAVNDQLSYIWN